MPSKCYGVCNLVDQSNNDIEKILKLVASRSVYRKYEPNIKNYSPKGFDSNYINGIKGNFITCDYSYVTYDGLMCPCCSSLVRTSPNKNKRKIVEPEPVLLIRSHVNYQIVRKGHYPT